MFKTLYNFFLNYLDKPSVLVKVNLFFYKGMNIFKVKCARSISWFSATFDKLQLNRIYVANKKWDWDYIVLRTWVLVLYTFVFFMIISVYLFF